MYLITYYAPSGKVCGRRATTRLPYAVNKANSGPKETGIARLCEVSEGLPLKPCRKMIEFIYGHKGCPDQN